MGGKTYIWVFSFFVFYIATTNSYVIDVPNLNNTGNIQNNYSKGTERSTEMTARENHNECGAMDTDYSFFEITNTCYKVHTELETWSDAEATCVREGGHLAVINSQHEVDFLLKHFPQGHGRVYIGFHWKELDGSGSWVTIQGQSLLEAGYKQWFLGQPQPQPGLTPLQAVYSKLEPNDKYGACGTLLREGTLGNDPCEDRGAFICEKDAKSQTSATTTEVPIKGTNGKSSILYDPDVCLPSPCGPNSRCQNVNRQAVCSCLPNYIGVPPACRPECRSNADCSKDKACVNQKCEDPCPDSCGTNSDCRVTNHLPICQCKPGYSGNPFLTCLPIIIPYCPDDACLPSPCGPYSSCREANGLAVCSCLPNHIGTPPGCRPECRSNADCSKDKACVNQKCEDPCPDSCGTNSDCKVINHLPIFQCKPGYSGNPFLTCLPIIIPYDPADACLPSPCGPYSSCREENRLAVCSCLPNHIGTPPGCRPECRSNADCSKDKACVNQKCEDPCPDSCGTNSDCRVTNHLPICQCKPGYSGNPFLTCLPIIIPYCPDDACLPSPCGPYSRCREANGLAVCSCLPDHIGTPPGCRPECRFNEDCSKDKACVNNKCQDLCPHSCGTNSDCTVINHESLCQCKPQYTGDPVTGCSPIPHTSDEKGTSNSEYSSELTLIETKCGTTDSDYIYYDSRQSCYKFHTELAKWDSAEATCLREGGHIAVINGPKDRWFFTTLIPPRLGDVWLKYRRNESGPIDQVQREGDANEYCVAMNAHGFIKVEVPCYHHRFYFICEKDSNSLSATTTEFKAAETESTEPGLVEPMETWTEPTTIDVPNECGTDMDYKFFEGTKSCYRVYSVRTDRETWEHAEATCVREGGHLAVINSQDEADFLVNLMRRLPRDAYQIFLGFHREHGSWMTIQGEHLSETSYENWREGEPNNIRGDQYCGSMYPDGTFDDIECWLKLAFICERKLNFEYHPESTTEVQNRPDTVDTDDTTQDDGTPDDEESSGLEDLPEPDFVKDENECGTMDTEYTFYESTQSCYKVHTERATWSDAEATCVREGGHLAVINSQHEADVLTTMYPEGAMHVFVGFSYRERDSEKISNMYARRKNGVWMTIDGQTLSEAGYESWTPGEPNNAGGREYCGTIYGNGKFDDSACYNKFDFICEIKPNNIL